MCLLFYFILFASHTILRLGNASKLSLLSLLRMGVSFVHLHRAWERRPAEDGDVHCVVSVSFAVCEDGSWFS
jgi:hypothetical protein